MHNLSGCFKEKKQFRDNSNGLTGKTQIDAFFAN